MSHNINFNLTPTQLRSLKYATTDVEDWIENAAIARAALAKDDIIVKLVAHCNANSIALAVGDSDQIVQAYDLGVVQTLADYDSDQAQLI